MKNPWFKFWTHSWLGDTQLRLCSLGARGLLIDLLAIMHDGERRGYLETPNGEPITDDEITRLIGAFKGDLYTSRDELLRRGVLSQDETGMLYSRRMVREAEKAAKCGKAGRMGGGSPVLAKKNKHTDEKEEQDIRKKIDDIGPKVTFKGQVAQSEPNPKPKRKPKRIEYGEDFDRVWAAYGRYGSKPKAWRYWQIIQDEDKAAIAVNIPIYLKCIAAGRPKKHLEGWINPENAYWDNDWDIALSEMTAPIPARKVEDAYHNSDRKSLLG